MITAYRAAKNTVANEGWYPLRGMTPDSEFEYELETIRARCRDHCRNNALAQAVMTTLIDYVASTGLTPTQGDEGAISVFNEWGKNCAINGRQNIEDVYRDIVGAQIETGDIGIYTPIDETSKWVKTRIDLIEGDRIKTPETFTGGKDSKGNEIRNGVVYDYIGREIGYYVAKIDLRTSGYKSGGAENYHYMPTFVKGRLSCKLLRRPDKMRPGMSRQLPLFVSIVQQLWDVDALMDAAINTARAKSMLGALVETDDPESVRSGLGQDQSKDEPQSTNIFGQSTYIGNLPVGGMSTVPFGTKITPIIPAGSVDIDILLVRVIRIMGAALGFPLELLLHDFSQTSFASGKLAFDGFFRMVDRWNRGNATQIMDFLYRLVNVEAYLLGDKRVSGLDEEKLHVQWIGGPKANSVNPSQEANAEEVRMNNNITTEEIIAAENGRNLKDIYESKARGYKLARETETKYDLPPGTITRTPSAAKPPVSNNDETKDTSKEPDKKEDDNQEGDTE